MVEKIFIGVGWPYANGQLHLGGVAGAYLPGDIFARYHRLKGNDVLMVSGSDRHGTPITIRAEQEHKTPAQVADFYHEEFMKSWRGLGISWDLFTSTGTPNHAAVTHDMFLTLQKKGYIYKATTTQPYCPACTRFLPDRYVEGVCPFCGDKGARGDQCDVCGKPLNAAELKEPRCRQCGTRPEFRPTEHFFFKLSAFEGKLKEWVSAQGHWRANVRNFTLGFPGRRPQGQGHHPGHRLGHHRCRCPALKTSVCTCGSRPSSATFPPAKNGPPRRAILEKWREFWQGDAKSYYFIGKDNIVFHTMNLAGHAYGLRRS